MRTTFSLAFALFCAASVGTAFAGDVKKPYTSDDIVNFMMAQKKMVADAKNSATRSVCIGSQSDCPSTAPKTSGFDLVVNFDINSANLRPESKENLLKVAKALQNSALSTDSFRIEGFTDALGTPNYNQKLSERRAKSVERFLAENQISTKRMTAVGFGEKSLRDAADPFSPENRRVELKLKTD